MLQELSTRINALNTIYSNTDSNWVQFIQDHKTYILNTSTKLQVSKEVMFDCRYRPEEFIKIRNLDQSITWIVLWLNQIDYINFVGIDHLWIPDMAILTKLHAQYKTIKAKEKKLFDKFSV